MADRRVFSQFAGAAAQGNDIVMHTEGSSMGNYCGIDDADDSMNSGRFSKDTQVLNIKDAILVNRKIPAL